MNNRVQSTESRRWYSKLIRSPLAIAFSLIAFWASASGQIPAGEVETLRLICTYSHTIDSEGKQNPTAGEDLITVSYSSEGEAVITKEGLGAAFRGTISPETIEGETQYTVGELSVRETISINRFTGRFELMFMIGEEGLIHYGTCSRVNEQRF